MQTCEHKIADDFLEFPYENPIDWLEHIFYIYLYIF